MSHGTAIEIPSDPITLGNILAASGFFSDSREGAQAAVKVMAGQELGIGPITAMTGINVIKGKVSLSANLMAACIKRHPNYNFKVRAGEHDSQHCVIDFFENGELVGTSEFTMEKARQAGLANQDNFKKHPENMLYARAMSNGAKWYCPDAFGGGPVYTPDELGGEVDGETLDPVNPPPVEIPDAVVVEPPKTQLQADIGPPTAPERDQFKALLLASASTPEAGHRVLDAAGVPGNHSMSVKDRLVDLNARACRAGIEFMQKEAA